MPAQLVCVALGARRWLVCILLAWGCVAMLFAAVRSEAGFLTLRLALGLAEAGAFPAIYYVLSLFYDHRSLGVAYTWVGGAGGAGGVGGRGRAWDGCLVGGVGGWAACAWACVCA